MAFRQTGYWKNMANQLRTYTAATIPKGKAYATTADYHHVDHKQMVRGDFVPVYVVIGMITLSVSLGLHTVYQQLANSPGVRVRKKTRETLVEVEDPDRVVDETNRFVNKSLFRKVAHVQEFDRARHAMPESVRRDAFAYKPHTVTLKDVGVDL